MSDQTVVLARIDPGEAPRRPRRNRAWAVPLGLAGIVGVGLFVRLWDLDANGFNSDEAVYAGQAAALAGNPLYMDQFPVFRAHPMLVQIVLSPLFRSGEVDVAGRVVIAFFGVATTLAVHLLGARLYDRRVGLLAALIVALMPYHVVVSRQVLLDVPMVLFATLTLHCVVRFVDSQRRAWFVAAGAMLGATMLAKEASIVLGGGVYAFLALTASVRRPLAAGLCALPALVLVFATHPLSQVAAGHASSGRSYLTWQLMRPPNHPMGFYAEVVPVAVGPLVLAAAAGGLWWLRRGRTWREILLVSWIAAPVIAFQLWPVKGFQYLLPVVPALAVLAARALIGLPSAGRVPVRTVAVVLVVVSLAVPAWRLVSDQHGTTFLAGSGGVPGGREAGRWLAANSPSGSTVLTLGPSMANILRYYSHRQCYGLSVSPNPLHRNPAYEPVVNPDRSLRRGELNYVVWDRYSARRSPHFSDRLLTLARRYHGRVAHVEQVTGADDAGRPTRVDVIVIYEVRP
jgi:hypothetical protein